MRHRADLLDTCGRATSSAKRRLRSVPNALAHAIRSGITESIMSDDAKKPSKQEQSTKPGLWASYDKARTAALERFKAENKGKTWAQISAEYEAEQAKK